MESKTTCKTLRRSAPPDGPANIDAWLEWLENVDGGEIRLGLENCSKIAQELGIDRFVPKVITVAGTNGKGSSCMYLEALLFDLGYKVATYSSPHIVRFNERIRINKCEASSIEICEAFYTLSRTANADKLTYFEFITITTLLIFKRSDLDFIILEVGLGGRLDAVNIVEPDVALITSIGLDHIEWLGKTRDEIGLEKAGIMRTGKPVVCSDQEIPKSIYSHANGLKTDLQVLGVDYFFEIKKNSWEWSTKTTIFSRLPLPGMSGVHQLRNISGALKCLEQLDVDKSALEVSAHNVLPNLHIPGRFQLMPNNFGIEILLDVAHNEAASEVLSRQVLRMTKVRRTCGIIGMLATKDHTGFLKHLLPQLDELYLVNLAKKNAAPAMQIKELVKSLDKKLVTSCYSSCDEALAAVFKNNGSVDRMIITGSFFTVGEATKFIHGKCKDE